ncbi:unnamed protein product [Effrenium voratum]|nr:unnamed protein product [Effrenium voratum]
MRELRATGFMSNRGRQNVASFLALDMGLDWRDGAEWFESYLLDYDVASNWGNWLAAAGQTTGRVNRFNVIRQSTTYDKEGRYIRHWIPELRNVPVRFIHQPWTMSPEEKVQFGAEGYAAPCVSPAVFKDEGGKGKGRRRSSVQTFAEVQKCPQSPQEYRRVFQVAYLSGRLNAELFDEPEEDFEAPEGVTEEVKSKYAAQEADPELLVAAPSASEVSRSSFPASGPSWEEIKAKEKKKEEMRSQLFIDGCYTPMTIERLCEEINDSQGIDLLLTSEWPKEVFMKEVPCEQLAKEAWPEEAGKELGVCELLRPEYPQLELSVQKGKAETRKLAKRRSACEVPKGNGKPKAAILGGAARQCSSAAVAELAVAAEAKYHAVGLGGVFWRRAPWRHERRGEVEAATGLLKCGVCRMITLGAVDGSRPGVKATPEGEKYSPEEAAAKKPQKWIHGLELDPKAMPGTAEDATPNPWAKKPETAQAEDLPPERPDFSGMDREERRRWMKRFGIKPHEMLSASDKLQKDNAPKEKKEKRQSLYHVSEKEKKRRKTGGDGHLPFHARERMQAGRG